MEGSWHESRVPCQDLHRPYFSLPEKFSQAKFSELASLKGRFLQAHCVLYSTELNSEELNSAIVSWGESNDSTLYESIWNKMIGDREFWLIHQHWLCLI
jgi:hypothetical protein